MELLYGLCCIEPKNSHVYGINSKVRSGTCVVFSFTKLWVVLSFLQCSQQNHGHFSLTTQKPSHSKTASLSLSLSLYIPYQPIISHSLSETSYFFFNFSLESGLCPYKHANRVSWRCYANDVYLKCFTTHFLRQTLVLAHPKFLYLLTSYPFMF